MSKVVRRRLQDGFIERHLSAEILKVIAQRLCCCRVGPRRLQCKECRTSREPFAEVAARDIPLHDHLSSAMLVSEGCLTWAPLRKSRGVGLKVGSRYPLG